MAGKYFVGVDVGTGSARAAVVSSTGEILALETKPISREELQENFITQSSTEIWSAICHCVKTAVAAAGISADSVRGIGFDATCSLVALSASDEPLPVGPDFTDANRNIMLWMDHRAGEETDAINATKADLLKYVGGKVSIEMEIPKVKWLKDHLPANLPFEKYVFYDLGDFLTHRACGTDIRSFCSTVCKQNNVPGKGFDQEFFRQIGLDGAIQQLSPHKEFSVAGQAMGGLTAAAAEELGLTEACQVGSGVIDAYAGWIGTIAAKLPHEEPPSLPQAATRLAAIAGTSTCHIVLNKQPVFTPGVWGPYLDVILPGFWAAEGGQSATGELLHHVLTSHPAYSELQRKAEAEGVSPFVVLDKLLKDQAAAEQKPVAWLARNLFYYADVHGNRSPLADPNMRGSFIGESLDVSLNSLALKYYAAMEFIALQTRHIMDTMNQAGHQIDSIFLSGGQCRNNILVQCMANACGVPVVGPRYIDAAVVFGAAMLGAAADRFAEKAGKGEPVSETLLWDVMVDMTGETGHVVKPQDDSEYERKLLKVKYDIFLDMLNTQRKYREMVKNV